MTKEKSKKVIVILPEKMITWIDRQANTDGKQNQRSWFVRKLILEKQNSGR
jgi:Arc/MetJ-type ribon-helix-helix transcriptional regulator